MTATVELVAAVREFIAGLTLEGREAFHAKVAANALAIVERELAGDADVVEVAALLPYCHPRESGDPMSGGMTLGPRFRGEDSAEGVANVATIRASLSAELRAGALTAATPGLLDALIAATVARLAVDNPRYPTLARLTPPASPDAAVRR